MFSFLKKDGEDDKKTSTGDWITLGVLVALAVGGYFYVDYAKKAYVEAYHQAEAIYQKGDYPKAKSAFDAVMNMGWREDSLEHKAYEYLDHLDSMETVQREALLRAKQAEKSQDPIGLQNALSQLQDTYFLDSAEQLQVKQWRSKTELSKDSLLKP